MKTDYLSRQSLLGLLICQISTIALHFSRLPIWLLLLSAVVLFWRFQIYKSQWKFPNRFIRLSLVIFSLIAVVRFYQEWYALEPMVTLLLIAFLLKLLEVDQKRDALVLIFVGYFVTACAFLFDQGIVSTFFGIVVLWLLTASLMVLQSKQTHYLSRRTLRLVSTLFFQAVPLMLLMLFIFPRIGALWSVPIQSNSGVTGVSDSMSPGDFSQLSRSRQLAFRVSFNRSHIPPPSERYWRGLVFSEFNGRRWQRAESDKFPLAERNTINDVFANEKGDIGYEVILEPTNTPWIYAIPKATIIDKPAVTTAKYEIFLDEPITQRIKYQVSSHFSKKAVTEPDELPKILQQSLLLPLGFNEQTLNTARQWRNAVSSAEAYINYVLRFYNENFTYTLSPPKLGRHSVDEFLFTTQQGFCEHFSSSFVVLMRAVGIPARVVVGYQGGEWNQSEGYLTVRQYDAHAWAEVWLPNQGWVRVDPTAAVAPSRIEMGLEGSLSADDQRLLESPPLRSFVLFKRLMLQWDALDYRWQRWVLSYDSEMQMHWLENVVGKITPLRLALLLIIPAVIFMLFISWSLLRGRQKSQSRKSRLYQLFEHTLKSKKVVKRNGDTVTTYCQRAMEVLPEKATELQQIILLLNRALYDTEHDIDQSTYQKCRAIIKSL